MKQKTENKYPSLDSRSTAACTADVSMSLHISCPLLIQALFIENRVSLETQSVGLTKRLSHTFVKCRVITRHRHSGLLFCCLNL